MPVNEPQKLWRRDRQENSEWTEVLQMLVSREEPMTETVAELARRYRDLKQACDDGYRELKEIELQLIFAMKESGEPAGLPIKYSVDEYRLDAWLKDAERERKAKELEVK